MTGKEQRGGSGDDVASGAKFVGASVASASIGATAIKKKLERKRKKRVSPLPLPLLPSANSGPC